MKASVIFMMATALGVSLSSGRAAEMGTPLAPGFYVGGVFRGLFIEDTNLKQLNGPASGTVSFDPGAGVAFKGGYRFCEWFALEGEFGFEGNWISSISGVGVDAALYQVPTIANAVLTLPTRSPLTPYFGAGIGASSSILDVDRITQGGATIVGTEGQTTFAWQAFAGLDYALSDRLSVGVTYNFRWVDGPRWDRGNVPIEFDDLHNHSGAIRVNYRF